MSLSKRIQNLQESPIRKLAPIAENAKKQGKNVYHLNIGQPDIKTPAEFLTTIHSFDEKIIKYSFSHGEASLLTAISNYYKTYDIDYKPEDILVTTGGSEALLFAMIALCDPGDNIIVPEPFYTNYNSFATSINVEIKPITTYADNGFHLPNKATIKKQIDSKTKAILFSNPGNPTGVVYTSEEIVMLKELSQEHDLFLISDEVYREFVYDNQNYISLGTLTDIENRVIIVDSVSKRYSACGARIGCIASKNRELMQSVLKLAQGRLCVATLEQLAAAKLYETPSSYLDEVKDEYEKRRNIVFETISKIDGVICKKPAGAFYIIAKLPIEDAEDFTIWLLENFAIDNETIMLAPAEGFYATPNTGIDEIRIAYILNEQALIKAMNIFEKGLKEYINQKRD